jgi:hypothetical protein
MKRVRLIDTLDPKYLKSLIHVTEKEEGMKKDWKGKSVVKGRIGFFPHALSLSDLPSFPMLLSPGKLTFIFVTFNEVQR